MKKAFSQAPLFRILVPFVTGLVVAVFCLKPSILFLSGFTFVAAGFFIYALYRYAAFAIYKLRWLGGLGIFTILFGLAILSVAINKLDIRPDFFAKDKKLPMALMVQITEPPIIKDKSIRAFATVKSIGQPGNMHSASGNLILYFEKDSGSAYPGYGDVIQVSGQIDTLLPPKNPGEFDYSMFMSYRNIYHSSYLKRKDWALMSGNVGSPFWKIIYDIRQHLKTEMEHALPGSGEKGIAEALVFGDESDIPNEVITDYAGTGTLHILSVSGLHVGIILLCLNWAFSFLTRIRFGKYIRLVLVLIIIWAYAFLTGFSPPIARSVIMFSLVYIGTYAGRRTNIYNSLCASALILLLVDPFLLMQAGFQLSFIALTGIVWLQPALSALWKPKARVLLWVWELSAASIAAQIVTLPISILYFNQLSLYFLPANLVVIPFSFIVMGTGIFFVFVRMLPFIWLHAIAAKFLYGCIHFLNSIVHLINNLPGANWHGLYTNLPGVVMLYLLIILLGFCLIHKKRKLALSGLAVLAVFLLARNIDIYNKSCKNEVHVLSIPKGHTVLSIKDANKLFVVADSSFVKDRQQLRYHINGYAWQNYIRPSDIVQVNADIVHDFKSQNVSYQSPWLFVHEKKLLIITPQNRSQWFYSRGSPSNLVDAVILSNNPEISLHDLYKKYHFKNVIAAAGNDMKKTAAWETECIENNIPFRNLQTDNSFSLQF